MKKLTLILLIFQCNLFLKAQIDTIYYLPDSADFIYEEFPIAAEIFYQHVNFNPGESYKILEVHYLLSPSMINDTIHLIKIYKDTLTTLVYSEVVNTKIDSSMVYPSWHVVKLSDTAPVFTENIEIQFNFNDYYDFCRTEECYTSGNSLGFHDGGQQWIPVCDPPVKLVIENLVTGIEGEKKLLSQFSLSQNYPNPFNPTTKIKYRIPDFGLTNLKIYDVLGNEIATLVNEEKPAGEYEVEFDASKFSSGVYFYTIKAGEFFQTNKMILMK